MKIGGDPRKRWLIGWAVAVILLGLWLLFTDKPWGAVAEEIEARKAVGKALKSHNYAGQTLFWTGLLGWIVLVVSGVFVKWWLVPLANISRGFLKPDPPGKWIWIGLIGIVAIGAAVRMPLASKSLWWDELWNAKMTIVGYYLGDPDEPREDRYFGAPTFKRSLWHYSRPTSHAVSSVPAFWSHRLLSDLVDPDREPHEFRDWVVRLPTLLVSLACIALIGFLGIRWGFVGAGLTAAFLLAVHPWHIRFGVEVRAYSWVFLWTLTGLWILTRIFREGKTAKWRYWLLFGLNQFLIVWSFLYAAFLAAGFFIGAAVLIWLAWPEKRDRIIAGSRLIASNILAALLFLHFFGPNFLQMREWFGTVTGNHEEHPLDFELVGETIGKLALGYEPVTSLLTWATGIFVLVSVAWGFVLLWKNNATRPVSILSGAVLLGAGLSLLFFALTNSYFYPRFISFALAPLLLLMALAWWTPVLKQDGTTSKIPVFPIIGILFLLSAFVPRLSDLRARPFEPLRDVADFIKATEPDSIPLGYGHGTEQLEVYLPEIRKKPVVDKTGLEQWIATARESGRPLYVIFGHPNFNQHVHPTGLELMSEEAGVFEPVAKFDGIEPDFTYRVLKLRKNE
ncbi:MAG: hypothetical protein HKN23_02560 [Verrucomicrobiales bacterium]|nr:hypothetical protein [Verrucomicrobiales bacterium]